MELSSDAPASPVYLDYNATTPVDPSVREAISSSLELCWGNPSSSHPAGRKAKAQVGEGRQHVASLINAHPDECIFTSGGTESNNLVFYTAVGSSSSSSRPHIVLSSIEHPSVVQPAEHWRDCGEADVSVVPMDKDGLLDMGALKAALKPRTRLVSLMLANNETGNILPIAEAVQLIKSYNSKILVHTDAAQALGKIRVDVQALGVDYLTIVGHKFYGPRIGALYVRGLHSKPSVPLVPMMLGGGQERSQRSGTENVAMIAGLGEACRLVTKAEDDGVLATSMAHARDVLEKRLVSNTVVPVHVNSCTDCSMRLPNTLNFSFVGRGLEGHRVLAHCAEDLFASTQAACHSGEEASVSQVLLNSGVSLEHARNAIRLSTGRTTSEEDAIRAADALIRAAHHCASLREGNGE